MEELEILVSSIFSNCENTEKLQYEYIKITKIIDEITGKRQDELERGM